MNTDSTSKPRRRSAAAKRVAARRAAEHRAGRFATGAHGAATEACIAETHADIRAAAAGERASKRRDTARRALAITGGAGVDSMPTEAASDARKWRGEPRSLVPNDPARDWRGIVCDPAAMPEPAPRPVRDPEPPRIAHAEGPTRRPAIPADKPRRVAGGATILKPGERLARRTLEERRR